VVLSFAVIPLLLVWLRAAGLVGQSLGLGGTAFVLIVLRRGRGGGLARARARTLALVTAGALLAAGAQAGVLAALAAALTADGRWPVAAVVGSTVGIAGLLRIAAALIAAAAAQALRGAPDSRTGGAFLLAATALLASTGALASHAMGRVDGRVWLMALDAVHQAAAGAWVGGLVCAAVLGARPDPDAPEAWLRPFSVLAVVAVAALAVTGVALSLAYVATPAAAIGTSYGAMVLTKVVLFTALLVMGALNHRALRGRVASRRGPSSTAAVVGAGSSVLRRRLEVEAGLAIVTLCLAASIGSAPPAVDVGAQRATLAEIRAVLTPQWPRLHAPSLAELASASALGDPLAPHTPEETAWSEFGHHVAGAFILAMGLLAMLERTGQARWARHWPLLFVGLTGFVAWSMDPEGWQTGRVGFWEQLLGPEVLEHRILLALTALLGLAEWRVHSGRHPGSRWRYVFPLVCIGAATLLLSHAHEVSNAKSAFFMELTHLLLGLVILVAGWARWLELRLSPPEDKGPGRLWAPALTVFGLLLLLYRET
jgi:copper resistance protein D